MSQNKLYSLIIPVFNSNESLIELTSRVHKVFLNIKNAEYEIIFIDDSSSNAKTWETLTSIQESNKNVICIQLMRNFGQQAATICGMSYAKGDFIITMDDDLQHLPEYIPDFINKNEHDIVIAQFKSKEHSFFKIFTSKLKSYFDYLIIGKPKNIQLSPYRMINRRTVNAILTQTNTPYPFIPAMMFYATKDVVGVQVEHGKRKDGKSGYDLIKMIKLFSNLLINNSSLLLRFIGNIGIIISIISLLLALFFVYKKLFFNIKTTGWTSLIVSILFIGGLNLFSLGLIGEYLIRIIKSTDKKPLYFIKKYKETAK